MRTRRRIISIALVASVLGGISLLVLQRLQEKEPVYQGKPLGFWLQGYDSGCYNLTHPRGPSPPTWDQANEAIRQIGTNAIPTLLRMLQQPDSKFKTMIVPLLSKQHWINLPFIVFDRNFMAYDALVALGPEAGNAVPRLIEISKNDPSAFAQQGVPAILGYIGPAARSAIPQLLPGITHTNLIVRNNAFFALRRIHAESSLVVPALIRCLNNPDTAVRAQAVRALGEYGRQAEVAVPALLELWRKEPPKPPSGGMVFTDGTMVGLTWVIPAIPLGMVAPDVGGLVRQAFQSIDPEAAAKAGVK